MPVNPIGPWTELAHRITDGLDVTLLWNAPTDAVRVVVADRLSPAGFAFEPPPAHALTAFRHPFAYVRPDVPGFRDVERTLLER
jgi:hypothetical protein